MGMYDSFFFEDGVLPDNKVPADFEFQTKYLDCDLDEYFVKADGSVEKFAFDGNGGRERVNEPINCVAEVYSIEFMYDNKKDLMNRKYLGSKDQVYWIKIVDSKLVHVEKLREHGYSPDKE